MDLREILGKDISNAEKLIFTSLMFLGKCEYQSLRKKLDISSRNFKTIINRCNNKDILKCSKHNDKTYLEVNNVDISKKEAFCRINNNDAESLQFCDQLTQRVNNNDAESLQFCDRLTQCVNNSVTSDAVSLQFCDQLTQRVNNSVTKMKTKNLNVLPDNNTWVSVSGEYDSASSSKKSDIKEYNMYNTNKKEEILKKNISLKSLDRFSLSPSARKTKDDSSVVVNPVGKSQRFKVYFDEILETSSSNYLRDDLMRFAYAVVLDSGCLIIIKNYVIGKIKSKFNASPRQYSYGEDLIGYFSAAWNGAVELYDSGVRKYVDEAKEPMDADDFCRLQHEDYFEQFSFFRDLTMRNFNFLLEFIQRSIGYNRLTFRQIIAIAVAYATYLECKKDLDKTFKKIDDSNKSEMKISKHDWEKVFSCINNMYFHSPTYEAQTEE